MDLTTFSKRYLNGDRLSFDIDNSKVSIKSHPLFQLLEYLFLKCEHSTTSLCNSNTKVDVEEMLAVLNTKSNGARDLDKAQSSSSTGKEVPWETGNDDLDQLMLNAVQVLRIQLLELEKVDELCKDFCSRYIACLKGKVTQEMLLGWSEIGDDDSCSPPPPPSSVDANGDIIEADPINNRPSAIVATMQTPNGQVSIPLLVPLLITTPSTLGLSAAEPESFFRAKSKQDSLLDSKTIKWTSNGASANILIPSSIVSSRNLSGNGSRSPDRESPDSETLSDDKIQRNVVEGSNVVHGSKGKRGSLPKRAVDILRAWLFQNIRHPYPSEEEKRDLCTLSSLNLLQVNNWFINARRRILQPLLDGASPNSGSLITGNGPKRDCSPIETQSHPRATASPSAPYTTSSNKRKSSSKVIGAKKSTRYWPESMVTVAYDKDNSSKEALKFPDAQSKISEK